MSVLGLDIGNVICKQAVDFRQRVFVDNALSSIIAVVPFFEQVFIVSKCSEKGEKRNSLWLTETGFFDQTGIKPENVRYCRERHEKAPICQELAITHFVDDRVEVLSHMESVRTRIALAPRDTHLFNPRNFGVLIANDWAEAVRHLRASLRRKK